MTFYRALIAGVGGIALYGALKPSGEKVIVVNGEQKPAESTTAAAAAAVTPVVATADSSSSAPLAVAPAVTPVAGAPVETVTLVAVAPAVPIDGTSSSAAPATAVNSSTEAIPSDGSTPLAAYPVTVTMAPADIPPYSGTSVHYDQIPLAPLPSETPLAPYPSNAPLAPFPSSSQPPMCAPGQNPDDPLMKCTPLTVAPMYVTPSTTADGVATVQREVSEVPVASNTNQNLQAQSALKSGAISSTTVFAINLFLIPILTLLMV